MQQLRSTWVSFTYMDLVNSVPLPIKLRRQLSCFQPVLKRQTGFASEVASEAGKKGKNDGELLPNKCKIKSAVKISKHSHQSRQNPFNISTIKTVP